MKNTDLLYKIALGYLHGFGPKKSRKILTQLDSLEEFFTEDSGNLSNKLEISKKVIRNAERKRALEMANEELRFVEKNQIEVYCYGENSFPRRLEECADSPVVLYGKGNMDLNAQRIISVVGTRNATPYGIRLCEELIDAVKDQGLTVVSGLAYGIDIAIHQLCVKHKVATVGVLGHGLDRIYPNAHRNIATEMLKLGGLVTEFPSGTIPDRENFPMRNRIVAGLSDATIVVESKASGGSIITADLAFDYNRDVFAFPGNVHQRYSDGCNFLIDSDKAHLLRNAESFMKKMNWNQAPPQPVQRTFFPDLDENEALVFQLIRDKQSIHADVLCSLLKWPSSKVSVTLFNLQMKGAVKASPGNMYQLL